MGPFQSTPLTTDPLNNSLFTPIPPLYGPSSSVPGTPMHQQPYQNSHFQAPSYMVTQSYDPFYCLNKVPQNQSNINTCQQVPQHTTSLQSQPTATHINQNLNDINNNSINSKYLLMPAPNVASAQLPSLTQPSTAPIINTSGQMSRSYTCPAGISTAPYDHYYIPQNHQTYNPANGAPLIVPQNQTLFINNNSVSNSTATSSFNNNSLDSNLGYIELKSISFINI